MKDNKKTTFYILRYILMQKYQLKYIYICV